jgi:hypothetical protein
VTIITASAEGSDPAATILCRLQFRGGFFTHGMTYSMCHILQKWHNSPAPDEV